MLYIGLWLHSLLPPMSPDLLLFHPENWTIEQKKGFNLMNQGETPSRFWHISQRKCRAHPGRSTGKGTIVKKLGLWIFIVALNMAVKLLLLLSRSFERLSQHLYRGFVSLIHILNKGG